MEGARDVYRELQKHIDAMPVGFPATQSGVELRLLEHLFTPEEAEIALNLSALPEPLERIHKRVRNRGISKEELEKTLDRLVSKGAIMGGPILAKGRKGKYYGKAQFAIGIYEFQVNRLTENFSKDAMQYFGEAFGEEFYRTNTNQMRTIPVNKSIKPVLHVGNYDDARFLVDNCEGPFAVLNCVCKRARDEVGEPCGQTNARETCITFRDIARGVIDNEVGREVGKEEILVLLDTAEREGLVLQPENNRNPQFICCCCGCCCGVLRMLKKFPRPAERVLVNYFAEVNQVLCKGCGKCVGRCQMDAVSPEGGKALIDSGRCIGCGLCVTTCVSNAVNLVRKIKETVPPKDHDAMYRKIMMEKAGVVGALKMMGKSLFGGKI
jgi:electron transport complex protein RnfB